MLHELEFVAGASYEEQEWHPLACVMYQTRFGLMAYMAPLQIPFYFPEEYVSALTDGANELGLLVSDHTEKFLEFQRYLSGDIPVTVSENGIWVGTPYA